MKKTVIISEQGRVSHEFIALVTATSPECDISIAAADGQDLGPYPLGSFPKPARVDETGET